MKKTLLFCFLLSLAVNFSMQAQDPYIGEIRMFAGNFAPQGWAKCEGQLLSIAQNTALFSLLGTTYGGDGETTFRLPDLRGRVPIGPGTGPGLQPVTLGQQLGSNTNTLTTSNLPAHNHTINAVATDGNQSSPQGNVPAGTKLLDPEYSDASSGYIQMNSNMVNDAGQGQPVNNMQPSQSVTFIIALYGIFPSQG
ncbi:MAG: tail fiber protein [Schleiferiaceae bacterium]|jgi:microcystin-dependent protein|nr:tail fiber protein [Schleiferiaceae bacterium]